MNRLVLRTPSRLHFGLLSWGGDAPRQFGGVGLMVDDPGLTISATPSQAWQADGDLAGRVIKVADRASAILATQGHGTKPLRLTIEHAPPEHVGLGVGTQVGLAVARILCEFAGCPAASAAELATLAGRGLRSAIGLHGFALGGLIVDGGRRRVKDSPVAPLIAHLDFPRGWSILIVIPPNATGLHGPPETQAFQRLPAIPDSTVDRLCRLVLLDLLPSVAEHDLEGFGRSLTEIQTRVGEAFAQAQGGVFARPNLEVLASFLQTTGLVGVGQSSWGPTLYGFSEDLPDQKSAIRARVLEHTGWPEDSVFWTKASGNGVQISRFSAGVGPVPD